QWLRVRNSHAKDYTRRRLAAVKRGMKAIPIAGSVFVVGMAGYEIRKKGLLPGVAHVGLDLIPFVGTTKNVIEIFTGDLIPDKRERDLPRIKAEERGSEEKIAADSHGNTDKKTGLAADERG